MRSCRSSVLLDVAGVATLSAMSSQPRSALFFTYESSTKPKAKPSPGAMMPLLRWPNTSPTSGMNPGNESPYWLRYERFTLRTIISPRATTCIVLYHVWLSSGSLAVTASFIFVAVSTLEIIFILLLSTLRNFRLNILPSAVFAVTMSRLLFLPWLIVSVVSGMRVISFSNAFLFFGSFFSSPLAELLPLNDIADRFLFGVADMRLLNLSLVFFRNGMWLYSFSRFSAPLMFSVRLLAITFPSDCPSSCVVPRVQLYVAL